MPMKGCCKKVDHKLYHYVCVDVEINVGGTLYCVHHVGSMLLVLTGLYAGPKNYAV